MEFLKEVLGEELYAQVAAKLGSSKIKLADLSGGAYVGKDKYDALNEQLKTAQGTLNSLGGKTIEQVKQEAADYKAQAEKAEKDADARVAASAFEAALTFGLTSAKARNPKAVSALINREGLELVDGKIVGLDEQLTQIKKDNDYMFDREPAGGAGFSGKQPPSTASGENARMNSFIRGSKGE